MGSRLGRAMSKETGNRCVWTITDKAVEESHEKRWEMRGHKKARKGKRQGIVDTDDEGGRRFSTSQDTTAKKAAAVGQACWVSLGIDIIWI